MEYKRIFKDSGYLMIGKAGSLLVGLINFAILARVLSVEGVGKYSLILMIINFLVIFAFNWPLPAISRYGKEEFVRKKRMNTSLWSSLSLIIISVTLLVAVILIFRDSISEYLGVGKAIIYLVLTEFLLNGLLSIIMSIFRTIDRIKKMAFINMFQKVTYLLGLGAVYFFGGGLIRILVFYNISYLLAVLVFGFKIDKNVVLPIKTAYLKKVWGFSWPHLIGLTGVQIVNYVDIVVIKHFLDLRSVGYYNIAYFGFKVVCVFMETINMVFEPLIVEYKVKGKSGYIRNYIRSGIGIVLVWPIVVLIGYLIAPIIVPLLFSSTYSASVPSLQILLFASIFFLIGRFSIPLVNAYFLVGYFQLISVITAILNIALDIMLVPKVGMVGAAYGTLISFMVGSSLVVFLLAYKLRKENLL